MAIVKYYQNKGRFEEAELCETENIGGTDAGILDFMFIKYNSDNRPDGKIRPSMSVGDIISIDGRTYQCARIGWNRL